MAASETNLVGELIRRAQAGELWAFEQIAQQHSEPLFRCALTLCCDHQLAEDISQEALLEAWRSIGRFDGRCRFSTWLYGILRHRFLKAARRVARRFAELPPDDAAPFVAANTDPSRESQRAEDAAHIRQAVAALPEEHRQVIELRFFADATLDDISAALDIPLGTVKSRLHNGLEKLRQTNLAVNLFSTARESPTRQP
jgi:RNA polymerase sigma-70 factor (ECF subfamily)